MSLRLSEMIQRLLRNGIQWAAVQWKNGKRNVINIRSVVSCKSNDLKPWTLVTVNWDMKRRAAVIVAVSETRESLETLAKEKLDLPERYWLEDAGPSNMADEGYEDVFVSGASLHPSEVEIEPKSLEGMANNFKSPRSLKKSEEAGPSYMADEDGEDFSCSSSSVQPSDEETERKPLEVMATKKKYILPRRRRLEEAGPSYRADEDGEDFSCSSSSWQPSDVETESADSDEDRLPLKNLKKVIEASRRLNMNRKSMKKVEKRTHRPMRVVPQCAQTTNISRKRNIEQCHNDSNNNTRTNRPVPNLIRIDQIKKNNINQSTSSKDTSSVDNMTTSLQNTTYVSEQEIDLALPMKSPESPESPEPQDNNTGESFQVDSLPGPSRHIEPMDEDSQVDEREFDRSDDNVLISNKFKKPLAEVINQMKAEEKSKANVPTTSGRSMQNITNKIKKDQTFDVTDMTKENKKAKTKASEDEIGWVAIGTGQTMIPTDKYKKVNWKSYTVATRGLLLATFSRRILATHSLTGKKSPAFQDKPAKLCLDPRIVSDVIYEVTERFGISDSLVRGVITTKCADEAKMLRMRQKKEAKENTENIPPSPAAPAEAEDGE